MPPTHAPPHRGFIGRTHQLRQVTDACAALARGHGSVMVVSGEAGIGKTRFALEAAARTSESGVRATVARCWVEGGAPPLWPWQSILAELCGDDAGDLLSSDITHAPMGPDRFERFVAVTDRLRAACTEAPACLVIDDVHAADVGTLLLIRFVARSLGRVPLALVLGRRRGEPAADTPEARLLGQLDDEATPIVLGRFDIDETARFLTAHGMPAEDPDIVTTLFRVTGGHPLYLRRIIETARTTVGSPTLPGGLQVAIQQALASLGTEARSVLTHAAILGADPSVTDVAALTGRDPVEVLRAAEEGAAAGLLTAEHTDSSESTRRTERVAFSHELVRSTFEQALAVDERVEAHARAATVTVGDTAIVGNDITAPPDRLARAAHHARAAAVRSDDDARRAVALCRAAAGAMVRGFAYEQADELLSAAVAIHTSAHLGALPARLAVDWAQAALLCGDMTRARSRFDQAAAAARSESDHVLAAEAALGLGGMWLNEHRTSVERARVLGLQRAALADLPDGNDALRCRLVTRLAAEDAFEGGPIEPVDGAVDAARANGDPLALAEALSLAHHARFTPEHTRTRITLADELVDVASATDHGVLALMGLLWKAVDLFHLGDGRAGRALENLRERAHALGQQNLLYMVAVIDVMLRVREGHLDEAETAALRCHELGDAIGEADAFGYLSTQILAIRWIQGRDAELLDTIEQTATSPTLISAEFALWASAAAIAARAGDHARAYATLDRIAPHGLEALPPSSTWAPGMAAIVEAAAALDDAPLARTAYDLLLPHADLPVVASLAVVCLGSTERSLGLAASVMGKHDLAVEHLRRGVATNRRLGNRPLTAVTKGDLAGAMSRQPAPAPGDRQRAADLLDEAIAEAAAMGLDARVATWQLDLRSLRSSGGAGSSRARALRTVDTDVTSREGVIHRHGSRWVVQVDDRLVRVGDLVGMTYLVELLTHPGRPIAALTLAAGGSDVDGGPRQELLDDEARRAYLRRADDLGREIAEAEAAHDIAGVDRLRSELDALADEVEAATGLGGRSRRFTDAAERARTAVRKAIKRAIDTVDADDPTIAALLRASVTTGTECLYTPDVHQPVHWSVRGS